MQNDVTTTELVQLENRYWQAIKDQDAKTCAELSCDPCVVTGAQGVGVLTKEQMRTMMEQQNQYTLERFELKDVQARMLGPDTAIVAYKVHEELTVEGRPVVLEAADTSTWVRRDGQWECAMHSEAILGDPFGRDRTAKRG
ncbi:MAG TPA: nuclear transport factor 2 family protein [Flavobacteriales bacterium]|nr:nuclear transport factor 2 family protein [Flavobacteriales bacterium]